jgi:hypothetical protein
MSTVKATFGRGIPLVDLDEVSAIYGVKVKQGYPTTLLQTRNAKYIVPSGNSLVQSL